MSSRPIKEVREEVELRKKIGKYFPKWDKPSMCDLLAKKEQLIKLGVDIDKKEKYALFGIPFKSEKLLHEALQEITISLGHDDKDVYQEGQYYRDEYSILEEIYNMWGNELGVGIGTSIADITKIIKLRTDIELDVNVIRDRLFDMVEKEEKIQIEEGFYFDSDIIDYFIDTSLEFGITAYQETDKEGDIYAVVEWYNNNDELCKSYYTADDKRDEYIAYLVGNIDDGLKIVKERANELLQDYKPVGTSDNFSQYQIKQGILNTVTIIKESIRERNILEYKPLEVTTNKMMKDGRNQYLERLPKLLKEAKVNYVLKDDSGRMFFPFIADMFFTHYVTQQALRKNEEIIKALKELEYQSEKLGVNTVVKTNDDIEKALDFHKSIKINQIWNYVATVYANKYNVDYKDMAMLIKFFIYPKSTANTHSLKEPSKQLPKPLTDLDKFTKNI